MRVEHIVASSCIAATLSTKAALTVSSTTMSGNIRTVFLLVFIFKPSLHFRTYMYERQKSSPTILFEKVHQHELFPLYLLTASERSVTSSTRQVSCSALVANRAPIRRSFTAAASVGGGKRGWVVHLFFVSSSCSVRSLG